MINLILKTIYIITAILLFYNNPFFAEDDPTEAVEIFVENHSGQTIYARFYPISAIFDGKSINYPIPRFTLENAWANPQPRR